MGDKQVPRGWACHSPSSLSPTSQVAYLAYLKWRGRYEQQGPLCSWCELEVGRQLGSTEVSDKFKPTKWEIPVPAAILLIGASIRSSSFISTQPGDEEFSLCTQSRANAISGVF